MIKIILLIILILPTISYAELTGSAKFINADNNGVLKDTYFAACKTRNRSNHYIGICGFRQLSAILTINIGVKQGLVTKERIHECMDIHMFSDGTPDLNKIVKSNCAGHN
jgi:hypothetical protein